MGIWICLWLCKELCNLGACPFLSQFFLGWKCRTGEMALSRRWHSARTQSSEIKGKWNGHTEQSDLPKSAQPDLLTPSLSLLWLLLRRWSWLIEIALFTDYHFNNLTSYVRNPAWGVVFFDAICLLLAFLTGGHQNQTSWVLFLFTFGFVSLSFRYSVVLLLQLHSHMTGDYSC